MASQPQHHRHPLNHQQQPDDEDQEEEQQQQQEEEEEDEEEEGGEEEEEEEEAGSVPLTTTTVAPASFDPQRWTDLETMYLIDCYRDKWYQLKRGQLKARHWEEVANNVFLRCGGNQPSKSSVQCRHKMEKLRKKYREEKQLEEHRGYAASQWLYYERMDAMERGIQGNHHGSSLHGAKLTRSSSGTKPYGLTSLQEVKPYPYGIGKLQSRPRTEEAKALPHLTMDDQDPTDYGMSMSPRDDHHDLSPLMLHVSRKGQRSHHRSSPSRKHHYTLPKEHSSIKLDSSGIRSSMKRPSYKEAQVPMAELASVVRSLGEGFLRIERLKLEVERDTEQLRAETELKRTRMLIDSQKHIAEMITQVLSGKKAIKKRPIEEIC